MTIRDLKSHTDPMAALAPAVRAATATGNAVDLRGFDAASVVVLFGAYTDGTHTPSLEASTDGVSYSAVGAGDLAGAFATVAGTAGANTVQQVGYVGPGRYLRPKLTVAGASTGAACAVVVLRGRAATRGV